MYIWQFHIKPAVCFILDQRIKNIILVAVFPKTSNMVFWLVLGKINHVLISLAPQSVETLMLKWFLSAMNISQTDYLNIKTGMEEALKYFSDHKQMF